MLVQAVVLDAGGALPAQLEGAFEGGVDEPAERREERVFRRLEDAHVKVEIGSGQIARAVLEALHALIGVSDAIDRGARAHGSRERRSRWLDHLPQNEEIVDEMFGRARLEAPPEHLGIEQIPLGLRAHARADLRSGDDQRLRVEHAVGFPKGGAGDGKARAHLQDIGQQRPGRIDPADNLPAQHRCELRVDVAFEAVVARSRSPGGHGPAGVRTMP